MKIEIDEFVLDNLFYHVPAVEGERDEFWWRETTSEGYIMVWADGEHFHTDCNPEDHYA